MKHVCPKFVPRLLTDDQYAQQQTITRDLLEHSCEDVQFLKNTVTGDKSWVYMYNPETKQQSSQWKGPTSPWPKKGHQMQSKTKVILLAFFDSEGIVHHEYAPNGQTILCGGLAVFVWIWTLHHDNAPAHTSHLVQQFLAKHGTAQLQQLPYSPDLTPCDFFLFPRLKKVLKGHWFEATEDIKWNSTKTLLDIPKEEFVKCFQQWQKRWAKCVAAEGNYVKDN